jgi:hypothetical protein
MSQVLVSLVGAGLLLLGLIALGKVARDQLRQHDRYTVTLNDIDCPAPPGLSRHEFLAEVNYLTPLPARLPALDDDTPRRLADAFARHPWVEGVEKVEVVPPDRARIRLVFRTPTLAVAQPSGPRVVDDRGILLPSAAPADGLPVMEGDIPPPAGLAGAAWGDPAVTAAAAVAGYLRPHARRLGLTGCGVRDGVVSLTCGRGRAVWGRAPGSEAAGEPRADEKLRRLLDACERPGGLDAFDSAALDLRTAETP